jgi:hypothetical protein
VAEWRALRDVPWGGKPSAMVRAHTSSRRVCNCVVVLKWMVVINICTWNSFSINSVTVNSFINISLCVCERERETYDKIMTDREDALTLLSTPCKDRRNKKLPFGSF